MLSATELAGMRADFERALPDSVSIERNTPTVSAMGEAVASWAAVATPSGRLAPAGNQSVERAFAEKFGAEVTWRLTLPRSADVTAKDRVVVGGRTLEVVAVLDGHAWELTKRLVCVEVKP